MRRLIIILTAIFIIYGRAAAQMAAPPNDAISFIAGHDKGVAANPPGLTFTLRTKDGRTTYHAGERIPIELVFENHSDTKYNCLGFNASRGQVGRVEQFVADRPEDAVDPQAYTEDAHKQAGHTGIWSLRAIPASPINGWC